jgi:dienelactone hydrolase
MRWRFWCSAILVAALAVAGCGGEPEAAKPKPDPLPPRLQGLFEYDRDAPLAIAWGRSLARRGISVRELSYAAPGGRVPAILVRPTSRERHPAVVFMHGSGGSRTDFLPVAALLATKGIVGLTLTSPFAVERDAPETVAAARRLTIRNVIDLRRAIDLLQERDDVDGERIGLVGYSLGAQSAVLAAAAEDRLRAVIVQAGRARASRAYASAPELDTVRYVSHLAPARAFFQAATRDDRVPPAAMRELIRRAREPKTAKWYPTGHGFDARAFRDQVAWLRRVLTRS